MNDLKVGFATPVDLWSQDFQAKQDILQSIHDAGMDHLYMADHVSFRNGSGTDGFVEMAGLSQLHPTLGVMISVYLLPLRHPLPVARQLATMNSLAPGRFMFGVGIGGDDRHEIEVCGIDPRTRGRLTNEALEILRKLSTGQPLTYAGDFFQLDEAQIRPKLDPPIPMVVGGRSDAALRRAARLRRRMDRGLVFARRFTEALEVVAAEADAAGRGAVDWLHGYQPWVGVASTKAEARSLLKEGMEAFYKVPFEKFEKYAPYGTAAEVADQLQPFVAAGCSIMNLKVVSHSDAASIEAGGEIARLLRASGS